LPQVGKALDVADLQVQRFTLAAQFPSDFNQD
jgi:hypothetical protein